MNQFWHRVQVDQLLGTGYKWTKYLTQGTSGLVLDTGCKLTSYLTQGTNEPVLAQGTSGPVTWHRVQVDQILDTGYKWTSS